MRWARFCQLFDDIDVDVEELHVDEPVQYGAHISDGYFVTVTTGYNCVDFCKFYIPEGQNQEAPTDNAVELPLTEWDKVRRTIQPAESIFEQLHL